MLTDSDGRRPRPAPVRPLDHRAAVAAPGPPVRRPSSPCTCSTGTARPRSARSSAGPRPTPRPTPRRSARSAGPTRASTSASTPTATCSSAPRTPPPGIDDRVDADGLRRHRRPGPHRRRRVRVDRGPGRRPHQPRRQQGVPRRRRGGAAPVAGGRRRRRGRGPRRPARRGARRVPRRTARARRRARSPCAASTSSPTRCPAAFHWIDELPRSEVGKVRRAALARSLTS